MNQPLIKFLFLITLFLLFYCNINAQIEAQSSFCYEEPHTCLSAQINEAAFVFEGTILEDVKLKDENGEWYLKTVLQVDKIFKGNLDSQILTFFTYESKMLKYHYSGISLDEFRKLDPALVPQKIGTSGIFFGEKSTIKYEKSESVYEFVLSKISLYYDLDFNINKYLKKQPQFVFNQRLETGNLKFSKVEDIYDFIIAHPKTMCKDLSFNEFSKATHEAWLKEKKKANINTLSIPEILSFTENIGAGTDQDDSKLTITGNDFGTCGFGEDCKIILETVQSPFLALANPDNIVLDDFDMNFLNLSWKKDTITVQLPSRSRMQLTPNFVSNAVLWSTRFKIQTSDGTQSGWSSKKLHIRYNLHQEVEVGTNEIITDKVQVKTLTPKDNNNILYFSVTSEILNNCDMMSQINRALKEWKCKTGIDWRVDRNGDSPIFIGGQSCCAFTSGFSQSECSSENSYERFIHPIRYCPDFFTNSDCAEGVYKLTLHELGHIHGLEHTIPGDDGIADLMQPLPELIPGANEITQDDLDGALKAIEISTNGNTCDDNEVVDFTPYGDLSMRDFEGDIGNEPNCEAYANPDQTGRPDVFGSPDVWNCLFNPNCEGNSEPLEGEQNWMRARVKNISKECDANFGRVHFYWTIASTGEMWKDNWIQDFYGDCLVGDFIGSSAIGFLGPEETRIVERSWVPPVIGDLVACDVPRYP